MKIPPNPTGWTPLAALAARFDANVAALAGRDADLAAQLRSRVPAATYFVAVSGDTILLGTRAPGEPTVRPLPSVAPADRAMEVVRQIFPEAAYTAAALVAGEDLGWVVDRLYRLPCKVDAIPGHRPPLYVVVPDLDRLWAILHVQDWPRLLVDPRVRLFAGPDAVGRLGRSLADDRTCPWPIPSVTVDPSVWANGVTLDALLLAAADDRRRAMAAADYLTDADADALLARLAGGGPLRVLGITSRYTTFLQHSMRDWLAGFEHLGHQTRLSIESADHHLSNSLVDAEACADFRPDLIVSIDHGRHTMHGLPARVPVVMWVQDKLPHIFRPEAGVAQGPLDYTIGYGRGELTRRCGYPPARFLPCSMAVNEQRFDAVPLPEDALAPHRCDASFVSHATLTGDQIVTAELAKVDAPPLRQLLGDLYDQLRAVYDGGGAVSDGDVIRRLVVSTMAERGVSGDVEPLVDLFVQRVNNALFRHQALGWVAELGLDLRLYGRGWEGHPTLARFARGPADNAADLRAIYQATAINLQVTPFGAVHPRLLDGLAAGGFFLLRSTAADEHEAIRRQMWDWARRHAARDGHDMLARRDGELSELMRRYAAAGAVPLEADPAFVFDALEECAATGFTRTANTLWDDAGRVTFDTREQLQAQVRHYLAAPAERAAVARSMRQRVLDTHTYTAVTRRLLGMIAADLRGRPAAVAA